MISFIILIFLQNVLGNVLPPSYYDYDSETSTHKTINKILLNTNFKIECKSKLNDFKFDRIIFNRSLTNDDVKQTDDRFTHINSYARFNQIFYIIDKQWNVNQVVINNAKYRDSGRYYCVYSTKINNRLEYMIESFLYLVYDDITLVKNFKEQVELSACVDDETDLKHIQWYYNVDNSENDAFLRLNSQTSGLIISLEDFSLFDIVYQCHNSMTGAFKLYRLECSNCDVIPPLISPTRQVISENSETQFTCEKPASANEPDRYQWFKHKSEFLPENSETNNFNLSQSIGYGSILTLKNVNKKHAGWYICCLVNSKLSLQHKKNLLKSTDTIDDDQPRFSCSSVELKVIPKNNETEIMFYILTVVCVLIILGMSVLIFMCSKKLKSFNNADKAAHKMQQNEFYLNEEDFKKFQSKYKTSSSIEGLLNEEDVHKWKIPLDSLKFGQEVGRGAFGVVIHGNLNLDKPKRDVDSGLDFSTCTSDDKKCMSKDVAIKKLPDTADEYNYYEMFKELQLMLSVGKHPHIVNLVGYCVEDNCLNIVLEYARFGNLKDFLRKDTLDVKKIGPDYLFLYAYQSALGMKYLHSKNILHRDLAARNILVEDYDSVKIADFGLARNIQSNYYYIQNLNGKVPFKWMSPESLSFEKVSKESDLWSYGVLLWEIFSYGCTPYPSIEQEDLLEKLRSGYRMERPEACDIEVYDRIIMKCWSGDPKQRPCFDEIVKIFEQLIESKESIKKIVQEKKEHYYDDYYEISPRPRHSNSSFRDDKLRPDTNWLSSSVSSFNPSTLTNTTSSTSTSHTDVKTVQNLFNLKQVDFEIEQKPLLKKNLAYRTDKTRKNPIYGGRIEKDLNNKDETKNWKNLFGMLKKPSRRLTVANV